MKRSSKPKVQFEITKGGRMGVAPTLQKSTATKKVLIEFPEPLLAKAEEAAEELSTDRSKLIRTALEDFLTMRERTKLGQELAKAYQANSKLAVRLCREFSNVDGDTV